MGSRDVLAEVLRTGARKMLVDAIEQEINGYLNRHVDQGDGHGRRSVGISVGIGENYPGDTGTTPVGTSSDDQSYRIDIGYGTVQGM